MQPGARPSAPARLHDVPDFAADDADQQQRGQRIDSQHADNHLMGRRDRRKDGKHRESYRRRQQRHRDGDGPEHARLLLRRGGALFRSRDLFGNCHAVQT